MKGYLKSNYWSLALLVFTALSCAGPQEQTYDPDMPVFDVKINTGDAFDGFVFLRKTTDPGTQLMINAAGQIVWLNKGDTTLKRAFYPYQDGYVSLHNPTRILVISYQKDTIADIDLSEQDISLHHEIIRAPNGDFLGISDEKIAADLSTVGGTIADTIKTDGLVRISPTGEIIWHWKPNQVLKPANYPDIVKRKKDWGHANGIAIDEDGHYLVSWRDFNEIWKIHSMTGELIWKHGSSEKDSGLFSAQHAINLAQDFYLLFDNGNRGKKSVSRAYGFSYDDERFIEELSIALPDSLYSFKQGSVYQIEEDKYLFCSSMSKYLAVTDGNGKILWLAYSEEAFYRAYYIPKEWME